MATAKFCECGCGGLAPIAKKTNSRQGAVQGEPQRYIRGHCRSRVPGPDFEVDVRTGCWVWLKGRDKDGYGLCGRNRRPALAHRWYWIQAFGPVPDGLELDHVCENRGCVNPAHLEAVTHAVNIQRGRNAKLDWGKVAIIRTSSESNKALAERFGVSRPLVSLVRQNKAWRVDAAADPATAA